jgi:integrase
VEPQNINLTDRFVESTRASNGRRIEFRDAKPHTRGLILRVSPARKNHRDGLGADAAEAEKAKGVKAWSVLYRRRLDGLRRRVTLGKYPAVSLAEARAKTLEILTRVARGEDPASDRARAKTDLPSTFCELADRYLEQHADRAKRSAHQDRQMLEKDILPTFRKVPLSSITRADIAEILEKIVARGAPIQANRTLEVVRGLYNWAMGAGLLETSPCIGLKAPSPERSRDRTLTTGEVKTFWQGLPRAKMRWGTAQILRLCLVTAQRVSEVAGAQLAELDFAEREWRLPSDRVKNRNAHVVPLSPLAVELFEEAIARRRKRNSAFVFASQWTDEPITGCAISRAMSRNLATLGLQNVTPHDLRRTAATEMAKLGIPRLVVDKVLNHVSADRSTIAGVYDRHSYSAEKREALDRWANRLLAIIGSATGPAQGAG